MLNLALWLKRNGFRADQVQAFYPSPMASATAMYHSGRNPLHKISYKSETVESVKDPEQRKLHKAFLRYHDPKNWPEQPLPATTHKLAAPQELARSAREAPRARPCC
jgi:radical SAM superfamily enzyme YgiQ (UPF0313 family)